MSNVDFTLFHTTYLCWLLFEQSCVSSSRSLLPGLCSYVWGGDNIGVRSCRAMGVFVLVLSNINIVWQKSLSAPLRPIHTACFENIWIIMFNNNVFILSILIMLR